ncbi:unnamed protein product [Notodromas monacha]|uniref:Uncharacterized protein n=1 Tax=Notodromas monacha TaxID=399045 RepID=A0A7R9GBE9_9CRUS|nr:unnamed protein product [Notodromas monacha]CAG0914932.1 unnamed protein product [Notodromas monacha]
MLNSSEVLPTDGATRKASEEAYEAELAALETSRSQKSISAGQKIRKKLRRNWSLTKSDIKEGINRIRKKSTSAGPIPPFSTFSSTSELDQNQESPANGRDARGVNRVSAPVGVPKKTNWSLKSHFKKKSMSATSLKNGTSDRKETSMFYLTLSIKSDDKEESNLATTNATARASCPSLPENVEPPRRRRSDADSESARSNSSGANDTGIYRIQSPSGDSNSSSSCYGSSGGSNASVGMPRPHSKSRPTNRLSSQSIARPKIAPPDPPTDFRVPELLSLISPRKFITDLCSPESRRNYKTPWTGASPRRSVENSWSAESSGGGSTRELISVRKSPSPSASENVDQQKAPLSETKRRFSSTESEHSPATCFIKRFFPYGIHRASPRRSVENSWSAESSGGGSTRELISVRKSPSPSASENVDQQKAPLSETKRRFSSTESEPQSQHDRRLSFVGSHPCHRYSADDATTQPPLSSVSSVSSASLVAAANRKMQNKEGSRHGPTQRPPPPPFGVRFVDPPPQPPPSPVKYDRPPPFANRNEVSSEPPPLPPVPPTLRGRPVVKKPPTAPAPVPQKTRGFKQQDVVEDSHYMSPTGIFAGFEEDSYVSAQLADEPLYQFYTATVHEAQEGWKTTGQDQ